MLIGTVGIAVSLLAIFQPKGLDLGDLASWAAAIGTIAAVSVALTQARQTRRLADRDRLDAYRQLQETQVENRRLRREDQDERERAHMIQTLIELLEAWDMYQDDTNDRAARARVRALISALPGWMARIAGIEVQVPRDPYDKGKFQPIHLMYWPPHREILKDHVARLEIEHNLKEVRGDGVGPLQIELRRFIERADNPYDEAKLTDEQQAEIQQRYEAELRGEPTDGARVTTLAPKHGSATGD